MISNHGNADLAPELPGGREVITLVSACQAENWGEL